MLQTSARLLRLLSLLQEHPRWTGPDLAARLDVTTRTVRRDVIKLRSLGYPVEATAQDGYRLAAGAHLPPLLLDDDEAVAVAAALALAPGDRMGEAASRALTKLEQLLPARLRGRVDGFRQTSVALPSSGPVVDPDVLATLSNACRDAVLVDLDYTDGAGTTTSRRVEPFRLVLAGRRWYLLAHDRLRQDWRTLRVDRIEGLHVTTFRFARTDPPDPAAFVARALSTAPYRHRVRARVHAPAEEVAAVVPPEAAVVEPSDDPAVSVLTAGGNDLRWLAVHLALLPYPVEVLDPPELRGAMAELAVRLQDAARPPTGDGRPVRRR